MTALQWIVALWVMPALGLSFVPAFIRLVKGPTLPDRVVALDFMATVVVGLIGAWAVATDEPVFIDVAILVALLSFLGTAAFAYWIERRMR